MKKLYVWTMVAMLVGCSMISPACAQNVESDKEYRDVLEQFLDVSGSPVAADRIVDQFFQRMGTLKDILDDEQKKELEEKWRKELKGKVLDLYTPIYQKHLTLDEMKELLEFYHSPVGGKLGASAPQIEQEAYAEQQKILMDMFNNALGKSPRHKKMMDEMNAKAKEKAKEFAEKEKQRKERDARLYASAYVLPADSIVLADEPYDHSKGTKPWIHSIEVRKHDTKVTFVQPIYWDSQWLYYSRGFKLVDRKTGDEYLVRGYDGGVPMGRLLMVKGFNQKNIYISLIFPKLKRSVDVVDIIEAPHKEDEELLPSNDDGQPKSFDFVVVDKYKRNHKVYK